MSDPLMSSPARQGLVARIQAILLKPAETWDIIAAEPATIQSIFIGYVVPLAAIGPICRAIGSSLVGVSMFGVSYHASLLGALFGAVVGYVLSLLMVYVMAFIVNALAPNFDGQKDMLRSFKLVAYSGTAGYVAGIVGLLPSLGLLALLAALYSIYIFYVGLPKLMRNPADKSIVYMVVIAICGIILSVIIGAVVGTVTMMGAGGAMLAGGHLAGTPGSFTVHDKNGSATIDLNQMQAAASRMEAQASAMKAGSASSAVKLADPSVLLTLTPATFNGAARSDTSTSSGGAAGVSAATAEATYAVGTGTIHLKIADMGSLAGLGAFANAMNVNTSSSSAGGYETVKTEGNRMTTERYNSTEKSGEYTILADGRISVEAEGSNVDMATMKALVAQVDINKAESLTK